MISENPFATIARELELIKAQQAETLQLLRSTAHQTHHYRRRAGKHRRSRQTVWVSRNRPFIRTPGKFRTQNALVGSISIRLTYVHT